MLGQSAFGLGTFGLAGGQCGASALDGQFKVCGLQANQQFSLIDVLVVLNAHLVNTCAQLTGNTGDLALNVGVVGAFVEAALEIPMGQEGEGDERDKGEEDQQTAFELGGHEYYGSRNVNKFNSDKRRIHKWRSRHSWSRVPAPC
ncbi:hypothetical protein PspTeo4_02448 [Pseudomonas sp. Teo4]|nr:hypothetical protein [Pseudomonas sp. Teo4]